MCHVDGRFPVASQPELVCEALWGGLGISFSVEPWYESGLLTHIHPRTSLRNLEIVGLACLNDIVQKSGRFGEIWSHLASRVGPLVAIILNKMCHSFSSGFARKSSFFWSFCHGSIASVKVSLSLCYLCLSVVKRCPIMWQGGVKWLVAP